MSNALRPWLLLLMVLSSPALGQKWTQPTQEELAMTSDSVPGAAAICLWLEVHDDDHSFLIHSVYVRLKILRPEGLDFADVELPYGGDDLRVWYIEARTIHSDGTVVPFSGTPYEKLIEKKKGRKYKAKIFTLPDVQVGSILEYRFVLTRGHFEIEQPAWYIQLPIYILRAHYEFKPNVAAWDHLKYFTALPQGSAVMYDASRQVFTLDVSNVQPIIEEAYMPPVQSISYRVLFYVSKYKTPEQYWKAAGEEWSKETDEFMKPESLSWIAAQIVAATDTPRQKAQKIYDAVMKLENTSLTREKSKAENKANNVKVRTAEDVWNAKQGTSAELTLLFVGLARAAGLTAYAARAVDRSQSIFVPGFLDVDQFEDYIAIVELDGQDQFLDPGERYCNFGEVKWTHAGTKSLRQTAHGTELTSTPAQGYKSTSVVRSADLTLDSEGKVSGTIRIGMTGNEALQWRQKVLSTDEEEMRKEFEDALIEDVPRGVDVKINHIVGLSEYAAALTVVMDVSGSVGSRTEKRLLIPATFFAAGDKTPFAENSRINPVDLRFPYARQDNVSFRFPQSLAVESKPKDFEAALPRNALCRTSLKQETGKLESTRLFLLATDLYSAEEYGPLKNFFQKVNANDQEQVILQRTPEKAQKDGAPAFLPEEKSQ